MPQKYLAFAALFVMILSSTTPAAAQSEAFESFVEKQFYGNRVKAGAVLLNGSFRATRFADSKIDAEIQSMGIGVGIGLGEKVVFSFNYRRDQSRSIFQDQLGQAFSGFATTNGIQVGLRILPTTWGGFIQPYFGLDYSWFREDLKASMGSDPFEEARYAGINIPAGLIVWISTFMSLSIEPVNFSIIGQIGDESDYDGTYSLNVRMLNPTFGINFLLNGKKP